MAICLKQTKKELDRKKRNHRSQSFKRTRIKSQSSNEDILLIDSPCRFLQRSWTQIVLVDLFIWDGCESAQETITCYARNKKRLSIAGSLSSHSVPEARFGNSHQDSRYGRLERIFFLNDAFHGQKNESGSSEINTLKGVFQRETNSKTPILPCKSPRKFYGRTRILFSPDTEKRKQMLDNMSTDQREID